MSLPAYVHGLTHLRTDAGKGKFPAACLHRAPHKPLLLLSVMDLIVEGTLTANLVEPTPDLAELFALYWSKVMPADRRSLLAYPFFHLRSEGFWHLVPVPGQEAILAATRTVTSVPQLKTLVLGARLDDDLFALLHDAASREALRAALLERYFRPELRPALLAQAQTNVQAFRYSRDLLDAARSEPFGGAGLAADALPPPARDQGFRRAVVTAYERRCGFCGIRMTTADGHTVVEPAHIVPWSESRNDDPQNGLALCRLCHWNFDEGLVSLSAVYVILASPQLAGNGNVPAHLGALMGRTPSVSRSAGGRGGARGGAGAGCGAAHRAGQGCLAAGPGGGVVASAKLLSAAMRRRLGTDLLSGSKFRRRKGTTSSNVPQGGQGPLS